MKRSYRLPFPVSLLILVLVFAGLSPSSASGQSPASGSNNQVNGQESYDILTYYVGNVFTREDRTAVARTGAAIEEIGAGYVIVRATAQEASLTSCVVPGRRKSEKYKFWCEYMTAA